MRLVATENIWTKADHIQEVVTTTTTIVKNPSDDVIERDENVQEIALDPANPPNIGTRETPPEPVGGGNTRITRTSVTIRTTDLPRVDLVVDGELIFELGVNLGPFIRAFPEITDLNSVTVVQNTLSPRIQPVFDEAARDGAQGIPRPSGIGTEGFTWDGIHDIVTHRHEYEPIVIEFLRKPSSILVRGGILTEIQVGQPGDHENGASVANVDVAVERTVPKSQEMQRVIAQLAEARYKAEAARHEAEEIKRRERGHTEALEERARRLGIPTDLAIADRMIRESGGSVFLAGAGIADALSNLQGAARAFQRGGRQGGPQRRRQGGGQQPPANPPAGNPPPANP